MKNKSLYLLALGAFISSAYAADTNLNVTAPTADMSWTDATLWDNGVPTAETTVNVTISSADYSLDITSAQEAKRLDTYSNANVVVSGKGSLTLSDDILLHDYSTLTINSGASVTVASGKSLRTSTNGKLIVDGGTFDGAFYQTTNAEIKNGATVNTYFNNLYSNSLITVDNSTFTSVGNMNGTLVLQNSAKYFGSNPNFNGTVKVLSGATVGTTDSKMSHFNISNGGNNIANIEIQGTDATKLSTIYASKLWVNLSTGSNSTAESNMHFKGNSYVSIGQIDANAFKSGSVLFDFAGNNNTLETNNEHTVWGGGYNNSSENVSLLMTTSTKDADGKEVLATNSTVDNKRNFNMTASSVENSSTTNKIDWAGTGNNFIVAGNLNINNSNAQSSTVKNIFVVRDGATTTINNLNIGNNDSALSGDASFVVSNTSNVVINNLNIGSTGALGGNSSFVVENGGKYTATNNVRINAYGGEGVSTAKSSLIIDGGTFDMGEKEFLFGYGQNLTSGTIEILIKGENSQFISAKKGFYAGHNSVQSGGEKLFTVEGKNNTVDITGGYFYMNSHDGNTTATTGGKFITSITGEGNTFKTNRFHIGKSNSTTGGEFVFSSVGANAANKNTILVNDIYIFPYTGTETVEGATVSLTFGGNTVLKRNDKDAQGTWFYLDNNSKTDVVGKQILTFSGSGNEINAGGLRATSNSVEVNIIGGGSNISFSKGIDVAGSWKFAFDENGITTVNASSVTFKDGAEILIDFSNITDGVKMEYLLIASNSIDMGLFTESDIQVKEKYAGDIIEYGFDTEKGGLFVSYTSAVIPEPSTYAMILGTLALAFVAYRRRK